MTVRALEKQVMDLQYSEIERRVNEILSGKVEGIAAAQAMRKARRSVKVARERSSVRRK
jgi:hypothetical protein